MAISYSPHYFHGMCGKFTQMHRWTEVVRFSDLIGKPFDAGERDAAAEAVTPMRFANVVTLNEKGQRASVRMRWGFVPSRASDPTYGTKHIHARAEGIETKPTFRDAFANRRGILLAATFNAGKQITPTKTEQYILTPVNDEPVGIAVIWERWTHPSIGDLLTFAMVTTPANPLIATITDRMPAIVPESDWPKWLGEEPATIEELKAMLRPSDRELNMAKASKPPAPKKSPKNDDQPLLI